MEIETLENDTSPVIGDAHGIMKLKGYGRVSKRARAKFVKVNADTEDFESLWEFMIETWKMKEPDLILSVNGGAGGLKTLSERQFDELKKGIRGVVASCSHIWIITMGFHIGVARLVGEAIKSELDLYTENSRISCIGICTWGVVNGHETLIPKESHDREGLPTVNYFNCTSKTLNRCTFDPHHTHFILCDDGTTDKFGADCAFRAKLEGFLCKKNRHIKKTPAPVVQIVVDGGKNTIKTAYESVKAGAPVVFLQGSGRAADFVPSVQSKVKESFQRKEAEKVIGEMLNPKEWFLTETEYPIWIDYLLEMALYFRNKVYVFNMNDIRQNLDKAILLAMFKDSKDKQMKLKLAMKMNRYDLAQQEIFTEDKSNWTESENLDKFMVTAIKNDSVEFVELFLNNGVNLATFVTRERLENLYSKKRSGRVDSSNDFIYEISNYGKRCRCNCCKPAEEKDILWKAGKSISWLVKKSFPNPYQYPNEKEDDQSHSMNGPLKKTLNEDYSTKPVYPKFPHYKRSQDSNKLKRTYSEQDLFFFCLLTQRFELAKFFCRFDSDPIATALVGVGITKRLSIIAKRWDDKVLSLKLDDLQMTFEEMAVGALDLAYKHDKIQAKFLVTRALPHYGNLTSMAFANNSGCQDFMYHPVCQNKLSTIWCGIMPSSTSPILIILQALLPIIFLRAVFPTSHHIDDNQVGPTQNNKFSDMYEASFEESNQITKTSGRDYLQKYETPSYRYLSFCRIFILFYQAPVTKFILYVLSYLFFLSMLTYVTLITLGPMNQPNQPYILEYFVWVWCIAYIAEEIKEACGGDQAGLQFQLHQWLSSKWNRYDLALYIAFAVTTIMRLTISANHFDWVHNFQSICLSMFFIRFMRFYYANIQLGPKVIMIYRMVYDVVFFILIYVVFLLAYGTIAQKYMRSSEKDWNVLKNIFYFPYWQTYGMVDLDSFEGDPTCVATDGSCVQESPLTVVASVIFMLFTNILIINLLIAMFGYTFQTVQESSEKLWAYTRYDLVEEFWSRTWAPPPISLLFLIYQGFKAMKDKCCKSDEQPKNTDFVVYLTKKDNFTMTVLAQKCMNDFWEGMSGGDSTSSSNKTNEDQCSETAEKVSFLCDKINNLEEKIEFLIKSKKSRSKKKTT